MSGILLIAEMLHESQRRLMELRDQLREKDEELARLQEDAARLDWLCSDKGPIYQNDDAEWHWGYIEGYDAFKGAHLTFRDAIDAARTKPTGEGK